MEELNKDDGSKKDINYDDLFKGYAEELLPKTTKEDSPDAINTLHIAHDKELQLKRIKDQIEKELNKDFITGLENSQKNVYDKTFEEIEKEIRLLPKFRKYIIGHNDLSPQWDINEFKKTLPGKFLYIKNKLLLGTEDDYSRRAYKKMSKIINEYYSEISLELQKINKKRQENGENNESDFIKYVKLKLVSPWLLPRGLCRKV